MTHGYVALLIGRKFANSTTGNHNRDRLLMRGFCALLLVAYSALRLVKVPLRHVFLGNGHQQSQKARPGTNLMSLCELHNPNQQPTSTP